MAGEDRLRELEEKYEGYKVYDNNGETIGKVDDLFVDEQDREEYLGVKMGLFGLSGTTLIPLEIARVNEQDRVIEVAESKQRVKDAPQYNDDDEIDRSFEERLRQHFDLGSGVGGSYDQPTEDTGAEGAAAAYNTMGSDDHGMTGGDSREPMGREEYRNRDDYASDSATASAAGEATTSGGVSEFETGDRGDRGNYREGERQDYYQDYQDDREGGATSTGGGEEARAGGEDTADVRHRDAYLEGYRQAIRDSSGQGGDPSGSTASGEVQGERSDNREGTGERDYQSEPTGYKQGRGGEGAEYEGRTRVRRLRRGS